MDSLIKRLQEAEAGSEQLDAAICIALQYGGANSDGAQNVRTDPDWSGDLLFEVNSDDCCNPIPKLTTSLDAIVALIGEKLPGWSAVIRIERAPYLETCELCAPDDPKASLMDKWPVRMSGGAKTAPLACCIALLSAPQSQEPAPPFIGRGET